MKITFLILGFIVMIVCAKTLRQTEFDSYLHKMNKVYTNSEYRYRLNVFDQNMKRIDEHNAKNLTWTAGINAFTDLTPEEFKSGYMGLIYEPTNSFSIAKHSSNDDLPTKFDWRDKNAVSKVYRQAPCGACYAFSAVGAVESALFIATNNMTLLSEQQVVDCTYGYPYENAGCHGGVMKRTYEYIHDIGLSRYDDYPYEGQLGTCNNVTAVPIVKVNDVIQSPQGDEEQLARSVLINPVSISMNGDALQVYTHGIINECSTTPTHAVLLVGFSEENGTKYWILKNSWGDAWGEFGFFRIQKDTGGMGMCAITTQALYPNGVTLLN